jgi:glycerol kinase
MIRLLNVQRRTASRFYSTAMANWVGALDLGTQSARFIFFDENCQELASGQVKLVSQYRTGGIVEQKPEDIIECSHKAITEAVDQLIERTKITHSDLPSKVRAVGITNQRETTLVWDKATGKPFYPAIGRVIFNF